MKNRLSATGGQAGGCSARVWLSREFVAWCERSSVVPAEVASAVLHTWGRLHPGRTDLTFISSDPDAAERIYVKRKGTR